MKTTTLNEIRKAKPCEDGWNTLLKGLGKTKADNEPLKLEAILKINGLDDACWVADKVLNLGKELRLYAYWNAKQSKKYVEDKKEYNKVLNTVNLYAYDEVGDAARASARTSARDSAYDEVGDAARDAAWASAWDATWDAARDSVWASVWASTSASARAYARASTSASVWASASDSFMKKSEKAFVRIVCNGNLPAKVKTTNHF